MKLLLPQRFSSLWGYYLKMILTCYFFVIVFHIKIFSTPSHPPSHPNLFNKVFKSLHPLNFVCGFPCSPVCGSDPYIRPPFSFALALTQAVLVNLHILTHVGTPCVPTHNPAHRNSHIPRLPVGISIETLIIKSIDNTWLSWGYGIHCFIFPLWASQQ